MPTEVKVLHQVSTRSSYVDSRDDVFRKLSNKGYYLAGTVQVAADVNFDNEEGKADWSKVLGEAWMDSQNDTHPNYVEDKSGNVLGTLEEIGVDEVRDRGYKVLPAVWNDEADFPQRSSAVGDLFIIDGSIYRVEGMGFKRVVAYNVFNRTRGVNLSDNPYKPDTL